MTLEIISLNALPISIAFFLFGALLPLAFSAKPKLSSKLGFGFAILGSLFALAAGVMAILGAGTGAFTLASFEYVGSLSISMDALSGFFVSFIAFVGIAVSIYSLSYTAEYIKKGYSIARFGFFYNIFLLSMILVVSAQNALLFLIIWEIMAISSYFLVTYEHKEESVQSAGFIYLLIAHIGAAALAVMFLALASGSGSMDFASFHQASYPPFLASAIFMLALFGFGSKCGIIPLHVWLPLAHPQAPSNISALMSGVMLKTAIYGLVRVLFDFLGVANGAELWWGLLILALGMISSIFGVLYSLLEHDIKRLLAYHSIENIGIIFIGIGAALLFSWAHQPALAALALFAALYHTLNHALFKSLLFLGAGSIIHATHERNIDEMGGLAKYMPFTAVLFFLGAASIAAIPPLNGFASEVLTFQALLAGIEPGVQTFNFTSLVLAIAVLALALTSALAVGAFVKAFGIPFLGQPRSKHAEHPHEAPKTMLLGMALLAVGCIAAGIFPSLLAQASSGMLESLHFAGASNAIVPSAEALPNAVVLLLLLAGSALIIWLLTLSSKKKHNHVGETWGCGFPNGTPHMQYSAAGFAMPVTKALDAWLNPLESASAYGPALFDKYIYAPISNAFQFVAPHSAIFNTGRLNDYLMYLILTLAIVLAYAIL
ncbi:MAG: proton-conducting transporter membrane subunit [Candidatus Micrarchaeota archaeon]|nr:proton-conducting transporter membrane subunit [Candidatus Micrarchaeota archaeon]